MHCTALHSRASYTGSPFYVFTLSYTHSSSISSYLLDRLCTWTGSKQEPLKHWRRFLSHSIYTLSVQQSCQNDPLHSEKIHLKNIEKEWIFHLKSQFLRQTLVQNLLWWLYDISLSFYYNGKRDSRLTWRTLPTDVRLIHTVLILAKVTGAADGAITNESISTKTVLQPCIVHSNHRERVSCWRSGERRHLYVIWLI